MAIRPGDMRPLAMVTDGYRLYEIRQVNVEVTVFGMQKGTVKLEDQCSFEVLTWQLPLGSQWSLVRAAPRHAPAALPEST